MKISGRGILLLFLLASGSFFCFAYFCRAAEPTVIADGTHITTSTTWEKSKSPYHVMGEIFVDSNARLAIEPGVVVKFEYQFGKLNVFGELSAVGTENDRIIFTSIRDDSYGGDSNGDGNVTSPAMADWQDINLGGFKEIKIKYAKIMYGGGYRADDAIVINGNDTVSITRSEISHNRYHGIKIINALPTIEENVIANNWYGVYSLSSTKTPVLKNNSFFGNNVGVTAINIWNGMLTGHIDARDNWWGDPSGPRHLSNPGGSGDKISDNVSFDPWLGKNVNDGTPDPVIVIPGIMGSWEVGGDWKIDPIFHIYDDLRSAFLANGYETGKNYFEFPYEWRDSNIENAKLLRDRINEIKSQTGRPKVDIVAHSMGGLLAREYIEADYFANDVDQLITIGTPHLGAPKDYIKWEAGEFFDDIVERTGRSIFYLEALENGYSGIFPYIREEIPSVRELLPVYNYLYDEAGDGFALRDSYPENYPRNEFLEELNNSSRIELLRDVELTKIIGRVQSESSTTSSYNVVRSGTSGLWSDGYPKYFDIPVLRRQGITKDTGDGTVPLYSAEATDITANRTLYFPSGHGDLPTDSQQDILEILTGKRPLAKIDEWQIDDIIIGLVFSPVDLQIISPNGEKLGKNFETGEEYNEIEGAYYSGFDTDTEFFAIPNPEDGEYKIKTQGTGEGGDFGVEVVKISENPEDPDNVKESSAMITGETQPDEIQEAEVEIAADEVVYNPDSTPPAIAISSPENMSYTNDKILEINYSVEDSGSGVESETWQVEKDGQTLDWKEKNINLSLEHLGSYTFKVSATDKAGNSGEKQVEFQITTNLDAIQNNLNHYFELGLVKNKAGWKHFSVKLENLEKLFDLLEKMKSSRFKYRSKQATIEALEKVINKNIEMIIRQLKQKSPRWIDREAEYLLFESLNAIRIK